jgi:NAD dependent epimerase/dehydratase family enzyme
MKVVIIGASGLLGSALVPFLRDGDHEVFRFVRCASKVGDEVCWDLAASIIDAVALEGVDAVVNLGREPGGRTLTERRKAVLRSSRLGPTRLLGDARPPEGEAESPRLGVCYRLLR